VGEVALSYLLGTTHCILQENFLGNKGFISWLSRLSRCLPPPTAVGVQIGTTELDASGNPVIDKHAIQGGVEVFLLDSCHRN